MTCSPDQSMFTNPSVIGDDGKPYVKELDYAVSPSYAQSLYDSCESVQNPTTGTKALSIICGNWEEGCTPMNWLRFLTDKNINSMIPFQINVRTDLTDTPMQELMNAEAFKCNETAPGSPGPCSCNDCPACCIDPVIPDEPEPWEFFGYHGSVVLVIFCYVIFVWAFGTSVIAWHLFCSTKQGYREGCCTLVDYYQNDRGNEDHSPIDR